mgnify:FL=1
MDLAPPADHLMHYLLTTMDTPIVSHATNFHPESVTLDHYDQLCTTETYCEDTLFAFGSEDYQAEPARSSKSTLMEIPFGSTITPAQVA